MREENGSSSFLELPLPFFCGLNDKDDKGDNPVMSP